MDSISQAMAYSYVGLSRHRESVSIFTTRGADAWPFERWQAWKDDEIFRSIKREDRQREAAEKKRDAPYEKIRKQAYRRSGLK